MNKSMHPVQVSHFIPENSNEVFDWLYKEYWRPLTSQAYFLLKDYAVAEEIVQQLFVDIYKKNILIKQADNASSYLRKSVKNRVYNYILKDKRYRHHIKNHFNKTNLAVHNSFDNKMNMLDTQKQIGFYLSKLDESCRIVFILNRDQQMTIKEIAVKLRRPKDTVTKQLIRAVKYLHKCINEAALKN